MIHSSSRRELRPLTLISAIAETPDARMAAEVLSTYHRGAGRQLQADGLLERAGDEAVAISIVDHDDAPVNLVRSPDGRSFGYFSPAAGWVTPDPEERAIFELRFDALLRRLLDGLDCEPAAGPVELMGGLLWEVGAARLPHRAARVPIWVARRLADPRVWASFKEQASRRPAPGLRLVLALTSEDRIPQAYVRGHEIVAVPSVVDHGDELRIDPRILAARLEHHRGDDAPVTMTAEGGAISVRGKTYTFTGPKQRAIIRHLYEAWRAGEPQCLTAEVLAAADSGDQVRSLGKAFKARSDWREFIREEGGRCWIDV